MERRLAAIMATDVVGYSRLIRADEEGTLTALKALRADLIDPKIAEHHGRIVKLMGDGMLVEFASVVDAVHAAVDTQQAMIDHNADVPADKRMELRIGINLGDVVIDGDDIQGDGVNVAARLEAMAEPGGIYVSGMVYEGVRDRIDVPFEDLGEQAVKNIDRPVRVWRWVAGDGAAPAGPLGAAEPLSLPDKLSIVVLPFDNMSGDPEQEYFSDGITEDITTELSRFPELFVIARNSAFAVKVKAVDVKDAANKLGVQYVVEGSVRKAGNRVRITAQLIDASVGGHIWADRYDRELEDIFEVQDDVVRAIVTVLPGRIADAIAAYKKAIELDPKCGAAFAGIAITEVKKIWDFSTTDDDPLGRAFDNAREALVIDDNDYRSHGVMGLIYQERGEQEPARLHLERALTLNPNSTQIMGFWSLFLAYSGDAESAIETYRRAVRLDPYNTEKLDTEALSEAYFMIRQYRKSIAVLETMFNRHYAHQQIAMCYARLGEKDACARHMKLYREQMPETFDEMKLYDSHMRLCQRQEDKDLWTKAYRKIGLDV